MGHHESSLGAWPFGGESHLKPKVFWQNPGNVQLLSFSTEYLDIFTVGRQTQSANFLLGHGGSIQHFLISPPFTLRLDSKFVANYFPFFLFCFQFDNNAKRKTNNIFSFMRVEQTEVGRELRNQLGTEQLNRIGNIQPGFLRKTMNSS